MGLKCLKVREDDGKYSELKEWAHIEFTVAELESLASHLKELATTFDKHMEVRTSARSWVPLEEVAKKSE